MKGQNWRWLVAGVVIGLVVGVAVGWRSKGVAAAPAALPGPRMPAEVLHSARELRSQRQAVISQLARLVASREAPTPSRREREEAFELLGDLHMSTPGTVAVLVDNVYFLRELPVPYSMTFPEPAWRMWPAFGALAKIGLPAIPPLVDQARTQQDKDKRRRSLFFLDRLVGEHAKSWLSAALRHEADPVARAQLEEGLEYRFYGSGPYTRKNWFFQPQEGGSWY